MNWSIKRQFNVFRTYLYKVVVVCNTYAAARPKQMFNVNCFHSTPPTSVCGWCSHKANKCPSMNCQTTAVHDILMTREHYMIQHKNLSINNDVCVPLCGLPMDRTWALGVDTTYSEYKVEFFFSIFRSFRLLSSLCVFFDPFDNHIKHSTSE